MMLKVCGGEPVEGEGSRVFIYDARLGYSKQGGSFWSLAAIFTVNMLLVHERRI